MPLKPRHKIIKAFHEAHHRLASAQANIQRATFAFGEYDVTASLREIAAVAADMKSASEHIGNVGTLIQTHMQPPAIKPLPRHDTIQKVLALAVAALNTAKNFKVSARQTDSYTIASQIEDLMKQLGGDQNA